MYQFLSLKDIARLDTACVSGKSRESAHVALVGFRISVNETVPFNGLSVRWLCNRRILVTSIRLCWNLTTTSIEQVVALCAAAVEISVDADVDYELVSIVLDRSQSSFQSLHLVHWRCNPAGMTLVFRSCATLRSLATSCSAAAFTCMPPCPLLRVLEVDAITRDSMETVCRCAPNLAVLRVYDGTDFTEETLGTMASHTPHLQELCVGGCDNLSAAAWANLGNACKEMHTLDLRFIFADDELLTAVAAHFPGLRRLSCSDTFMEQLPSFTAISRLLPQLECLELGREFLSNPTCASGLQRLSCLTALVLPVSSPCSSSAVHTIAVCAPQLQRLHLALSVNKGDEGTLHLATHCTALRELVLGGHYYSDENPSLVLLAEQNPHLQSLTLLHAFSVTNEVLLAVARSCPALRRLSLPHSRKITGAGLEAALALGCTELRELDASAALHITDTTILLLAQRCVQLERLLLSHTSAVTPSSVEQLVAQCRRLQQLTLGWALAYRALDVSRLQASHSMHRLRISACT